MELTAQTLRTLQQFIELTEVRDEQSRRRLAAQGITVSRSDVVTDTNKLRAALNFPRKQPLWQGGLTAEEVL